MLATPLLLLLQSRARDSAVAHLRKMSVDRARFERYMRGDVQRNRDATLYKMMPGGGYSIAYYPQGVASRRYMIDQSGKLIFEQLRGEKAVIEWELNLGYKKWDGKPRGTLDA